MLDIEYLIIAILVIFIDNQFSLLYPVQYQCSTNNLNLLIVVLLQYYRDLTYVTRDGMTLVINNLNQIALEKYLKLHDYSRTQVMIFLFLDSIELHY